MCVYGVIFFLPWSSQEDCTILPVGIWNQKTLYYFLEDFKSKVNTIVSDICL